ncbi:glucose-6-phosphate isomerase [Tahibacter caeni]|uniref:glucose-6-phosphate isomerase n=1 Tax=Tahibacter caeni TaxID=1453545 RepID=UPI002148A93B|nr:glucose-6-phosphate isomerase [Tahibacter caeni]
MLAGQLDTLAREAARLKPLHLRELLAEPGRFERFSRRAGPLLLDFSRQKLDESALQALGAIAEQCGWRQRRDAMFRGDLLNRSEQRPVLHTALRAGESQLPSPAPAEVADEIARTLRRMGELVDALERGDAVAYGIPAGITDVVNLGIGGSDLGPRLAVEALAGYHSGRFRCHFLPNVDGHETAALMRRLDPRKTLVLLVSKSFTTQETLLNGAVLRRWIAQAYDGDEARAAAHFVAVSANVAAAQALGIPPERVLPMWDFVGGRYSVWSAVGLVLALAIGMPNFRAFLRGAALMDDHFRSADDWRNNLPVLLALIGVWNRNGLGHAAHGVIPYLDALRELPAFLQQLEMESLGKRVGADGGELLQATVPVVWGSVGTNAQHAFFQALHQGSDVVPLDLIGAVRPGHALEQNHAALLANLLAQGAAFALGKTHAEALAEATQGDAAERAALAAQRTFPGDRPSSTLLLDALTPESLGALIALYEHKVVVQALLWDINAFDQWGVELGKVLAKSILPVLGGADVPAAFDASTRGLIAAIRGLS